MLRYYESENKNASDPPPSPKRKVHGSLKKCQVEGTIMHQSSLKIVEDTYNGFSEKKDIMGSQDW